MSFSLGEIAAIDAIVSCHCINPKLIKRVAEERKLIQEEHAKAVSEDD